MTNDLNERRIDHIKSILPEVSDLPKDQKELIYQLTKHIIQLCSDEYEKDIKEICNILKI